RAGCFSAPRSPPGVCCCWCRSPRRPRSSRSSRARASWDGRAAPARGSSSCAPEAAALCPVLAARGILPRFSREATFAPSGPPQSSQHEGQSVTRSTGALARRYARALLDVAAAKGQTTPLELRDELRGFASELEAHAGLRRALAQPALGAGAKHKP